MFARSVHFLQIFPILMLLLVTSRSIPLWDVLNFNYSALAMSTFSTLGFLTSLGKSSRLKELILFVSIVLCILILLNFRFFTPTIGIAAILLAGLAVAKLFSSRVFPHQKGHEQQPLVFKYQIVIAYLLLSISFFVLAPHKVRETGLLYYSLLLAGVSVLYLSLVFTGFGQRLKAIMVTLIVIAFGLMLAEFYFPLEVLKTATFLLATGFIGYLFINRDSVQAIEASYASFFAKPEFVIVGYFAIAAVIGSFVLQTPIAQANPIEMGHIFIDSLFTAMSAICVTGLIVLDTSVDFSFFGQATILVLIQLGGLGITSLSAWILLVVTSGRLNIAHEEALQSLSGNRSNINIKALLKKNFMYFLVLELFGTLLLFPSFFISGDSWHMAVWRALFTSVSAFCNAGFALQSNSLIPYQTQPFVMGVVSVLAIAGAFAPLFVLGLPEKIKRMRLTLQDKVIINTTVSLLVLGFLFFIIVEWDYSLKGLQVSDKISNAWLQSAAARTAGFNSIEVIDMRSVTQLFLMLFMFIGGNPGSVAGGVKTVTVAVLAIAAYNALKERDEATAFFRKIPYKTVFRALLVVVLAMGVHFTAFFFLSVTQNIDPIHLLFETFSALGTVGLSLGATAHLDEVGKVIVIFCMLAGRVGPLTFIFLLMRRQKTRDWKVPQEDVSIM